MTPFAKWTAKALQLQKLFTPSHQPCQMGNIGNTHLMGHSPYGRQLLLMIRGDLGWVPSYTLPSILFWEDDQAWEMLSQASSPSGCSLRWTHHPYLVNIFLSAYLSIILLADSKIVHTKMFINKFRKMLPCVGHQMHEIPLKMTQNGQELSELCSIFVLEESEHPSSPRRLMGLMAPSFLGTARHPGFAPGCSPFPSCLGATQVSGGLALSFIYYSDMYLKFKVTPGSFGEG